jgi:uncharacterized membrane protein (DUF106 family)
VTAINSFLRGVLDLTLLPLRTAPAWVSLTLYAGVMAVLALLVYKRCSNQRAIEAAKRRMAASIFEIRLFNDDLRAILRAQGALLRDNLRYLGLNLVPLVVMLALMLPLFAHLQFVYGYEGLPVGKPAVVTVELGEPELRDTDRPDVELRAPDGVRIEAGPLWLQPRRELSWRLVGERPGRYELALDLDGREATKSLVVASGLARRSPIRQQAGLWNQLLYPAEDPLPSGLGVDSISLAYPERDVSLLGFEMHWSIAILILSLVIALVLRKRFGVTF